MIVLVRVVIFDRKLGVLLVLMFLFPVLVIVFDELAYRLLGDSVYLWNNIWLNIGYHVINLQTLASGISVILGVGVLLYYVVKAEYVVYEGPQI